MPPFCIFRFPKVAISDQPFTSIYYSFLTLTEDNSLSLCLCVYVLYLCLFAFVSFGLCLCLSLYFSLFLSVCMFVYVSIFKWSSPLLFVTYYLQPRICKSDHINPQLQASSRTSEDQPQATTLAPRLDTPT